MAESGTRQGESRYEGQTEDAYPELFDIRAMLPQPSQLKPGQLSADLVQQYFEDVSVSAVYSLGDLICP